jgi:methylmalonyl-CoA carboxyltransferase small subunit
MKLKVTVNGIEYDVDVEVEEETAPILLGPATTASHSAYALTPTVAKAPGTNANALVAPIAGTVLQVVAEEGASVKAGDTMVILEAMKMETEVTAPRDGTVAALSVSVGDAVQGGDVLLEWAAEG